MFKAKISAVAMILSLAGAASGQVAPAKPPFPKVPRVPAVPSLPDKPSLPAVPALPDVPQILDRTISRLDELRLDELHLDELHLDELRVDFPSVPPLPPIPPLAPDFSLGLKESMLSAASRPDMELAEFPRFRDELDLRMKPGMLDGAAGALPPLSTSLLDAASAMTRPGLWQDAGIASQPPRSWAPADPADSLYKLARETLNRGEYRRAAQLFQEIGQRYPGSVYATDARYWKAFSLYRIGSADDLREALRALEMVGGRFYQASLLTDAATLAVRIRGALAARGDTRAYAGVSSAASKAGEPCDREDAAVRIEALNSLGQMDPESTTPILRRILAKRDECSSDLRRRALFLLARRTDNEAQTLVFNAARSDADVRVRADAIRWVSRIPGEQAVALLEEISRSPENESLQRMAVEALVASEHPRAWQAVRSIIERTDVKESLRVSALSHIDANRPADGGAYLRSVYPKLETPRLRMTALSRLAKLGGAPNEQFLLAIARNTAESVETRAAALSYAGRGAISITDLVRMYDAAPDRPLREQLLSLYSRRTEPEATDKLIDIARSGTDPELRRQAISSLSRKNDPRTKKLLLEIIDK